MLKSIPGVVAAIHVAGLRGDPCGAVRWTNIRGVTGGKDQTSGGCSLC